MRKALGLVIIILCTEYLLDSILSVLYGLPCLILPTAL